MTALAAQQNVFDRMLKSNLQPEEKNVIKDWAHGMLGIATDVRIQDAPGGMLSAFRQTSEGLATAASLAYLHVNVRGGLDVKGMPIDGAGGLGLVLLSAFLGHSELGTDARNIGEDALTICAFRKLVDGFARARLASGRELYDHLTPGGNGRPVDDSFRSAEANL